MLTALNLPKRLLYYNVVSGNYRIHHRAAGNSRPSIHEEPVVNHERDAADDQKRE